MPTWIESRTGRAVDAAIAAPGGRPLPGYHSIVADGEHVGFVLELRDSAGPGKMYLRDSAQATRELRDALRYGRYLPQGSLPYLPQPGPAVPSPMADNAATRDAIRLARYG